MLTVAVPVEPSDSFFKQFSKYPKPIATLLYNRGFTSPKAVEAFLLPEYHMIHDPYQFRDMKKACERIYQAIERKERIAIHGDYDADGVTGSVILKSVLTKLGADTIVFLPHRDKDGYGLNSKTVSYLHKQEAKIIITCDCGISNAPEIADALQLGIDTIVTDHHQIPKVIPDAYAIIHPKLPEETYPFKDLAGGGVAFKLVQGLLRHTRCPVDKTEGERIEKWLLDLVAISSVADMVSLVGENRTLVKFGLLVLSKNKRLGLANLLATAQIDPRKVTAHTIGFQIAPRINAAGRMDHANTAYKLLMSSDKSEAQELAKLLENQNKQRQKKTESMYKEALGLLEREDEKLLLFYNDNWTAGLTGLLAGKLSKRFNKPVFVMGFDGQRVVGSGRSPAGINILQGINSVGTKLLSYGGHPQACGFRFDKTRYDEVAAALRDYFNTHIDKSALIPVVQVEAELTLDDISPELVSWIEKFAPLGQGNPDPLLYTKGVHIDRLRAVGKKMNHLKLDLSQKGRELPAIAFDSANVVQQGDNVDIVYTLHFNEWNGYRETQIQIKHFQKKP